jgi:hypothetical protein
MMANVTNSYPTSNNRLLGDQDGDDLRHIFILLKHGSRCNGALEHEVYYST